MSTLKDVALARLFPCPSPPAACAAAAGLRCPGPRPRAVAAAAVAATGRLGLGRTAAAGPAMMKPSHALCGLAAGAVGREKSVDGGEGEEGWVADGMHFISRLDALHSCPGRKEAIPAPPCNPFSLLPPSVRIPGWGQ